MIRIALRSALGVAIVGSALGAQSETRMREMFSVKTARGLLMVAARSDGKVQFTSADLATRHDCLLDPDRVRDWAVRARELTSRSITASAGEIVESVSEDVSLACNAVLIRRTSAAGASYRIRHSEHTYPIVTTLDDEQLRRLISGLAAAADSTDAMASIWNKPKATVPVYFDWQVDTRAELDPGDPLRRCADSKVIAKAGDRWVAFTFVVDSLGRVPRDEIKVDLSYETPLPGLIRAVREALIAAKFNPARLQGRAVAQLVSAAFACVE